MPTEDVEKKSESIPLNLQALFYNLQTRNEACGTRDLTVSFGWGPIESFQQHDIQEFLRVLIDNIETTLTKADRRDAIADIFRGKQQRTISNAVLGFKHRRVEYFYDLPLQVRGVGSLVRSLDRFVRSEHLTGDNKYDTGGPLGKIDVDVRFGFLELPKVLQLHLKRFEYDITRLSLAKVDDRFEFEDTLDMRPFLEPGVTAPCTDYQLFAVLVHSGTAIGGHY
jgi:ubiquitin carboxyl-terminal hydrolase 7